MKKLQLEFNQKLHLNYKKYQLILDKDNFIIEH